MASVDPGFNRNNSEAPINRFCVLSKYIKGGFPRDRVGTTREFRYRIGYILATILN
jgi:hypothetical protein